MYHLLWQLRLIKQFQAKESLAQVFYELAKWRKKTTENQAVALEANSKPGVPLQAWPDPQNSTGVLFNE